jgi:hypothetical protein
MTSRVTTLAVSLFAGALLIGTGLKQRELTRLRVQNQKAAAESESARTNVTSETSAALPASSADESAKTELLRLRNEVSQLMERKKGLASLASENQALQARLAAKGTNNSGGLPPGYLRTKEAQWAGTASPENTLQSFLWALRNRDQTNLVRLMTPESARRISDQMGDGAGRFFDDAPPGARLFQQETNPDGSIEAQVEVIPGEREGAKIRFRQINGEWKMDL